MSKQKRWPGYYINTKLKEAFHRTPDRKNTTKREHLMVKNVIPTHQTEVHWRHSQRRSHITMLSRRLTPFWNIEMPHKRDQNQTFDHTSVRSQKMWNVNNEKKEKSQKSICADFNEELQASSEEFNKHITIKNKKKNNNVHH